MHDTVQWLFTLIESSLPEIPKGKAASWINGGWIREKFTLFDEINVGGN